jgi:hypothetical protein
MHDHPSRYHFHYDRHKEVLEEFANCYTQIRGNQEAQEIRHAIEEYIELPLSK